MRVSVRVPRRSIEPPGILAMALIALVALVWAVRCGAPPKDDKPATDESATHLQRILDRGILRAATRNAPTMYYVDRHDAIAGPEVDLVRDFAAELGVEAEFVVYDTIQEVLAAAEAGDVDLAAAGLNATVTRAGRFRFGPAYQDVRPQVVCRRGGPRPQSLEQIASDNISLEVVANSSYVEHLRVRRPGIPGLTWTEVADVGTEQVLEHVWDGTVDCTVADSNIVAVNRRYHPELTIAFDLADPEPLVWVLPRDSENLQTAAGDWFEAFQAGGGLADWVERYYGFVELFDYVDIRTFHRRLQDRFPKYRDWFVESAEAHGVPWTTLSAQSYQESHWNPRAKSPTGVRGIMMLTQPTAKSLGITNRLDARSNIEGGAKYLAQMEARIDEEVQGRDRLYMALAAYNVGLGHVRDAQTLAERLGKNRYSWVDLKETLPLLTQKKYYKTVKYGYARGREPVRYVEQIRNYGDILEREFEIRR